MYTVYALIDPRDWSIHYVGMTDNVYTRFQQHIRLQSNNEQKNTWLQSLKDADVMVFMKTLETADNLEDALQKEAYWIRHYIRLKSPLTNRYLPTSLNSISVQISPAQPRSKKFIPVKRAKRDSRLIMHRPKPVHMGNVEDVVALLRDNPSMKYAEIAEKTGYSRGAISKICTKYLPNGRGQF